MAKNQDIVESPAELEDFLRGCEGKGVTRIEARHLVAGKEQADSVSIFELHDIDDEGAKRFNGDEIYHKLQSDADGFGNIQRYMLHAFRDNSKTPIDRLGVKLDGGANVGNDASESFSNPNQAMLALVQQSHRHVEAMVRAVKESTAGTLEMMGRVLNRVSADLDKAHDEKSEVFALLSEFHKVDREKVQIEAKVRADAKRDDAVMGVIKLLGPAVIAKFTGDGKVKEEAVSQLIQSLNPEQQQIIFGTLNAEQRMALGAILDKKVKEEQEEPKGEANHGS